MLVWTGFSELSMGQVKDFAEDSQKKDCRSALVKIHEPEAEYLPKKSVSDKPSGQALAPSSAGERSTSTPAVQWSGRDFIDFMKYSYRNGTSYINFQGQEIAAPIGAKWDEDNIVFKLKKRKTAVNSILQGFVGIQKFEDFPPDHVFEEFFNRARERGYQPLDPDAHFSTLIARKRPHINQELPDIIGYSVMSFSYPGMGEMFFVEGVIKAIFVTVSQAQTYTGAYLIVDTPAADNITVPLWEEPAHNNTSNVWIKPNP